MQFSSYARNLLNDPAHTRCGFGHKLKFVGHKVKICCTMLCRTSESTGWPQSLRDRVSVFQPLLSSQVLLIRLSFFIVTNSKRKEDRKLIRAIVILLVALTALAGQQLREGRIQDGSINVDFVYRSQIEQISDHEYKLTHIIQNNSSSYLSVDWKDAGIACVGTHHLAPGKIATKTGDVPQSPSSVSTTIKYGVTLNHTAYGEMYINPQPKSAGLRRETTFETTDDKGAADYSIRVISEVNTERNSSKLTFEVDGGLSFALAIDTQGNQTPAGLSEAFSKPMALQQLNFRDKLLDPTIEDWIGTNGSSGQPSFFLINNPGSTPVDLVANVTGDKKFTLKKVRILAFKPGQLGFLGFTAEIFLPENIHAR